jgi:penicillin-binding protein 1A
MYSKNTITAQVMHEVGPKKTAALAHKMGILSPLDPVPALALGTSPVTPLEMVSAYGTIANGGEYVKPIFITRITDRSGKVLAEFETHKERALSPKASEDLIDMMRGVVNQGTGTAVRSRFGIQADIAGKTGTTQNNTDGWFVLMHPRLVAGSWVGFNDSRVTMRSSYWGQGAHNALLVVGDFFQQSLNGRLIEAGARFPRPDSMFGPLRDRVDEWFGSSKPDFIPPPLSPEQEQELETPPSDLERMIEQARQEQRMFDRDRRGGPPGNGSGSESDSFTRGL